MARRVAALLALLALALNASAQTCPARFERLDGMGVCKDKTHSHVKQGVASADACCALCAANANEPGATAACTGWTWWTQTAVCHMTNSTKQGAQPNVTSGMLVVPPKPQPPLPPPGPNPPPAEKLQPHIIMLLVDDWGWANSGWHRSPEGSDPEVVTPNLDALVKVGIELNRTYAFKFCSPTRSSLQSGRLPTHVNVVNAAPDISNPNDPVSGFAAIPRNMTGMATKLASVGYVTHQIGKWDAGMATHDHTPEGRGYSTSFGYFHHDNDYWREKVGSCKDSQGRSRSPVDLWYTDHGASKYNGTKADQETDPDAVTDYEEYKFGQRMLEILTQHDVSKPLFLNYDFHIVHEPLQVPAVYMRKFDFMNATDYRHNRQTYHAMVNFMDGVVGNLTAALKARGMWEHTFIALQSDNGGPSFSGSSHTANNWPLRGSKMSNWEGGVRVNGFVSGGFLNTVAPQMVGTTLNGFVHACDWYATFCALGGVDKNDRRAFKANLPPVDGLDMWPYFTGKVAASPRTEIFGDVDMVISGEFKLIAGQTGSACWMGPHYPNNSVSPGCSTTACGKGGCLFNIFDDPTEHHDISQANPGRMAQLTALLAKYNEGFFHPIRGRSDPLACDASEAYGNFWGPWIK